MTVYHKGRGKKRCKCHIFGGIVGRGDAGGHLSGGGAADSASDTPRGTSGLWSQCPWGRRRPLRGAAVACTIQPGLAGVAGRLGRSRASDTPRSMSGLWSQCPWGKPRPYGEWRWRVPFNRARWELLPGCGRFMKRPYGGVRCRLPFFQRGCGESGVVYVSVCHSPAIGGDCYRVTARRGLYRLVT